MGKTRVSKKEIVNVDKPPPIFRLTIKKPGGWLFKGKTVVHEGPLEALAPIQSRYGNDEVETRIEEL